VDAEPERQRNIRPVRRGQRQDRIGEQRPGLEPYGWLHEAECAAERCEHVRERLDVDGSRECGNARELARFHGPGEGFDGKRDRAGTRPLTNIDSREGPLWRSLSLYSVAIGGAFADSIQAAAIVQG